MKVELLGYQFDWSGFFNQSADKDFARHGMSAASKEDMHNFHFSVVDSEAVVHYKYRNGEREYSSAL